MSHPLGVDKIAWKYPSLRIVLAHVGVPWHQDACEVAWKNDNVWLDISGVLLGDDEFINNMLSERKLPDAVPGLVINDLINALTYMDRYDRVLYATDWPVISSSMLNYRRFIEVLIPEEHHQKVFWDNAKELFGVGFGEHKE